MFYAQCMEATDPDQGAVAPPDVNVEEMMNSQPDPSRFK